MSEIVIYIAWSPITINMYGLMQSSYTRYFSLILSPTIFNNDIIRNVRTHSKFY